MIEGSWPGFHHNPHGGREENEQRCQRRCLPQFTSLPGGEGLLSSEFYLAAKEAGNGVSNQENSGKTDPGGLGSQL